MSNDISSEAIGQIGAKFYLWDPWAEKGGGLNICVFFMKIGSLVCLLWQLRVSID